MAGALSVFPYNYWIGYMASMSSTFKPTVKQAVTVSKAIAFGGGVSPWQGKKGVIKKLLSARASMVLLEGDTEAMMFFNRELSAFDEPNCD